MNRGNRVYAPIPAEIDGRNHITPGEFAFGNFPNRNIILLTLFRSEGPHSTMGSKHPNQATAEKQRPKPLVPHVLVSILAGVVFVVAVGLVVVLPSMFVVHLVDWLELSGFGLDLSWIIALWGLSAFVTVAGYFLMQQTFIRKVLNRRVVSKLPEEIFDQ